MGRSVLSRSAQRDSMYRAEQDRLRALAGCTASHMEMMPECSVMQGKFYFNMSRDSSANNDFGHTLD